MKNASEREKAGKRKGMEIKREGKTKPYGKRGGVVSE